MPASDDLDKVVDNVNFHVACGFLLNILMSYLQYQLGFSKEDKVESAVEYDKSKERRFCRMDAHRWRYQMVVSKMIETYLKMIVISVYC